MPTSDELKIRGYLHGEGLIESTMLDGTAYVREPDGTWRYAHNWVKVPGARDMTLTERFQPKFIVASGNSEIERVIVSGEDVRHYPELLEWCLQEGVPVRGDEGELVEVLVPIQAWDEHDRIPEGIVAPEHSDSPAHRELAEAEREYREADLALEAAAAHRAEVLRRWAEEMTRQEAREITGLSIGRIQQLIRENVEDLDAMDSLLLSVIDTQRPKTMKAIPSLLAEESGFSAPAELIKRRVANLLERGLVSHARGRGFAITPEGKDALVALRTPRADDGDD